MASSDNLLLLGGAAAAAWYFFLGPGSKSASGATPATVTPASSTPSANLMPSVQTQQAQILPTPSPVVTSPGASPQAPAFFNPQVSTNIAQPQQNPNAVFTPEQILSATQFATQLETHPAAAPFWSNQMAPGASTPAQLVNIPVNLANGGSSDSATVGAAVASAVQSIAPNLDPSLVQYAAQKIANETAGFLGVVDPVTIANQTYAIVSGNIPTVATTAPSASSLPIPHLPNLDTLYQLLLAKAPAMGYDPHLNSLTNWATVLMWTESDSWYSPNPNAHLWATEVQNLMNQFGTDLVPASVNYYGMSPAQFWYGDGSGTNGMAHALQYMYGIPGSTKPSGVSGLGGWAV